jgi:hypothetical protein
VGQLIPTPQQQQQQFNFINNNYYYNSCYSLGVRALFEVCFNRLEGTELIITGPVPGLVKDHLI